MMIQEYVDRFMEKKLEMETFFGEKHVGDYEAIVKKVIEVIANNDDYDTPDKDRIHRIDDGDYQGTILFIIAASGYQPSDYWFVKVDYGSCSGCDTLENIRGYEDKPPNIQQVKDYMTLALHVVQGLKEMK